MVIYGGVSCKPVSESLCLGQDLLSSKTRVSTEDASEESYPFNLFYLSVLLFLLTLETFYTI